MEKPSLKHRILQLHLRSSRLLDSLDSGNYRSLFKGFGLEFSEVRPYVEADDPRLIDWNVSSRMNEMYSKVFQQERELTVMMMLDLSASMFVGASQQRKIDHLITIFALIAFAAAHNSDRVGSLFFSDRVSHYFKPRKDRRYVAQQLAALLNYCQQPSSGRKSNLGHACQTLYERASRRGSCVIVSDFRSPDYHRPLALLARRHNLLLLRLNDPFDYDLPPVGLHTFLDAETNKRVTIVGQSPRSRHNYALYWDKQRQGWLELARRCRIPAYEINSQEQVEAKLLQLFSSAGRRR